MRYGFTSWIKRQKSRDLVLEQMITDIFAQLMYFGANVSYASLPLYLPTILEDIGYGSINAQGLSAPPYFSAFLFALLTTWLADKTQQRGFVLTITTVVGGSGYIVLATVKTAGVRYFATFLAAAGVFSTIPNILAWTLSTSLRKNALRLYVDRQNRQSRK